MGTCIPALLEHAKAAAAYATDRIYRAHPDFSARFGEKGKRFCEDDIAMHLRCIDGALETGSSLPFVEYLRWLRSVLLSRGVPDDSLAESISLLGEYFEDKLQAHEMGALRCVLDDGIAALADARPEDDDPVYLKYLPTPLPEAFPLVDNLTRGEIAPVRDTMRALQARGIAYRDLAVRLFQPALYQVGRLWQANRISVAQEHLATAIVQNNLALAYSIADCAPPIGRRALFACIDGNLHAIGLRMVSDVFELAGWESQYLGASLPMPALLSQVDTCRPHLIGLSASLAQHIPALKSAIAALRGEFGQACPAIMVGGLANNQVEDGWKAVGADLWAPAADSAVQAVSSWQ